MKAKLITYSMTKLSCAEQNQLRIKLIGHNDTSHGGKYKYRRKGLLDELKHIKPSRNTIILPTKEANEIIKLLQDFKAEINQYDIELSKKYFLK